MEKNVSGLYRLKSSVEVVKSHPPRFCSIMDDKIHNKTDWLDRFPVNHKTLPLMLVKTEANLTPDTAEWTPKTGRMGRKSVYASAAMMTAAAIDPANDFKLARQQWKENACLPGSVFLTPDGKNIWISDIDLKHFEEVEL